MRNLVKVILLVILAAGLSSCEKIKGLFDVEFDTTLSGDLEIDIQESAAKSTADYTFDTYATINMFDDEDIAEYDENIKQITVSGVVAEVIYVNKENVVFKSGTVLSISDNNNLVKWTMEGDWSIVEGTKLKLEGLGDIYEAVEDILNKKGQFEVGAKGECSETGVSIVLRIGIDIKVIANPI